MSWPTGLGPCSPCVIIARCMVATSCPRVVDPNCKHRALSLCSLSPCLQFSMAEQPSRASPLPLHHRCSCVTAATATSLPLLLRRCYCCCATAAAALLQLVTGAAWSGQLGRSWAKSNGPTSAQAGPGTPPPLLLAAGEPQAGRSLPLPGARLLSVLKMKRRRRNQIQRKGRVLMRILDSYE
jgi:hypothetical protein